MYDNVPTLLSSIWIPCMWTAKICNKKTNKVQQMPRINKLQNISIANPIQENSWNKKCCTEKNNNQDLNTCSSYVRSVKSNLVALLELLNFLEQ